MNWLGLADYVIFIASTRVFEILNEVLSIK